MRSMLGLTNYAKYYTRYAKDLRNKNNLKKELVISIHDGFGPIFHNVERSMFGLTNSIQSYTFLRKFPKNALYCNKICTNSGKVVLACQPKLWIVAGLETNLGYSDLKLSKNVTCSAKGSLAC